MMKTFVSFLLCIGLCMTAVEHLSGQSVRLTTNDSKIGLEAFLMPGKNPSGDKLLQFHFQCMRKKNTLVYFDSLQVITGEENLVSLSYPSKDTVTISALKLPARNTTYTVAQDTIDLLKREKIEGLAFYKGTRQTKLIISQKQTDELAAWLALL